MDNICFQKYSYDKCLESKLLGARLYVLDFILERKKSVIDCILMDGLVYYHISRMDIAHAVALDEQSVTTALRFLKKKGLVQTYYNHYGRKFYIAPIIDSCRDYLAPKKEDTQPKKEEKVLFEYQEKNYSKISEEMVTKLAEKNRDLFGTRIPKEGAIPSASFTKACQFLDDLYNGRLLNPRFHATIPSLEVYKGAFCIEDYQDTIKACEGNWTEIHKLLNKAVKNYRMMKEVNRMPLNKTALPRSIDEWFEDTYRNVSYFVYSFTEPPLIRDRNDEKLADELFDKLPKKARHAGNDIFDLNPSVPDALYWQNITDMVKWGNTLCKYDMSVHYWISNGSDLVSQFYDYLKKNNISVSLATTNIEKGLECNGPWSWFLNDAINRYRLSTNILRFSTVERMVDYYEKRKAKLSV